MRKSIYRWSLRPEAGLSVEVRVVAWNASVARRDINRFLAEHDGASWVVESVSREADLPTGPSFPIPDRWRPELGRSFTSSMN
jgi:hypothetical protein